MFPQSTYLFTRRDGGSGGGGFDATSEIELGVQRARYTLYITTSDITSGYTTLHLQRL